jgi:hypothetical protein
MLLIPEKPGMAGLWSLKSTKNAGEIFLTASADGLKKSVIKIKTKD